MSGDDLRLSAKRYDQTYALGCALDAQMRAGQP